MEGGTGVDCWYVFRAVGLCSWYVDGSKRNLLTSGPNRRTLLTFVVTTRLSACARLYFCQSSLAVPIYHRVHTFGVRHNFSRRLVDGGNVD